MISSPTTVSEKPSNAASPRYRIRKKLMLACLLAAGVPIMLHEMILRAQGDPWQAGAVTTRFLIVLPSAGFLAFALARYLARGWTRQAASVQHALTRLAVGDAPAKAEVIGDDEWTAVAVQLNDWGRTASCRSEGQPSSEQIEASLQQLSQVSMQVSSSASHLGASTEKLSKESEYHMAQINDTSAAVDEIVDSIRQVAENTFSSAKVASEARHNATVGSQAVANTIQGMQRIRNQVQSTSKRIKQLGESTQQIGEIVQLISDVADRTSLLALNASIQAAMAGEAGQGFGVVAEEVESLSKRCNEATKQMARLVKGVQAETSEAIAGMEESIAEVVNGSKLASQAGEALADIDAVSARLADLINSISAAAKQQVRGGLLASRSMNEISAVMHDNAVGTKSAVEAARELAAQAEELQLVVQRFGGSESVFDLNEVDSPASSVAQQPVLLGSVLETSDWPEVAGSLPQ